MEVKEAEHQNQVKAGWFGGEEQGFGSAYVKQIGKVWWIGAILFHSVYQIIDGWFQCWTKWVVEASKSSVLRKDVEKLGYA
jgi:hypothetical protein